MYNLDNCHAWRVADVLYAGWMPSEYRFNDSANALLLGMGIGINSQTSDEYHYFYSSFHGFIPTEEILNFMRIIKRHPECYRMAKENLLKSRKMTYGVYGPNDTPFIERYKSEEEDLFGIWTLKRMTLEQKKSQRA